MHKIPKFTIGQVVHHKQLGYRGVIVDVDGEFTLNSAKFPRTMLSQTSRKRPWYRILLDRDLEEVYVSQDYLALDVIEAEIENTDLCVYFSGFSRGRYQLKAHAH